MNKQDVSKAITASLYANTLLTKAASMTQDKRIEVEIDA